MKKNQIGDVFEITTNKGLGYFQCVNTHKTKGELIIVFNKLYSEEQKDLELIISVPDYYFYNFPLIYAWKRKLVRIVGNCSIPQKIEIPLFMRDKHIIRGEFLGWHIINTETLQIQLVQNLNEEQKNLSQFGIINDTFLKERLEAGWSPRNWV
jgi:hypothetical protein